MPVLEVLHTWAVDCLLQKVGVEVNTLNQKTKVVSLQICQFVEGIAMQKGHQFLARLLTIGLRLDLHFYSKDGKICRYIS